jgi:hypothetical protein
LLPKNGIDTRSETAGVLAIETFKRQAVPKGNYPFEIIKGKVARVTGLEPATSGVTGRHSNQLSYTRALSYRTICTA